MFLVRILCENVQHLFTRFLSMMLKIENSIFRLFYVRSESSLCSTLHSRISMRLLYTLFIYRIYYNVAWFVFRFQCDIWNSVWLFRKFKFFSILFLLYSFNFCGILLNTFWHFSNLFLLNNYAECENCWI